MNKAYNWRFFRTAHLAQVKIENGEDLAHLSELDCKLWTALAMPLEGVRFDARALKLMDSDGDGRLRLKEVLAAVDYLKSQGVELNDLFGDLSADRAELEKVIAAQGDLAAAAPCADDLAALKAWEDLPLGNADILPLGPATAKAESALSAVEAVVDGYFAVSDDMPLVTDAVDAPLPLTKNLNPKWLGALAEFARLTAEGILKRGEISELTRLDWQQVKSAFMPYRAWIKARPVMAAKAKAELEVRERVLRYKLSLVPLLNNFLNQADLYAPDREAIYQTGTLFIASRACSLCFHVADESAHAALALKSDCCIVYARLSRKGTDEKRRICAVITAGDTAPLYVGRNGVFYDRDGRDWDATVTRIVENPVSLREAFWAPWKKLGETLGAQVKKFIGEREAAATGGVTRTIDGAAAKDKGANAAALASSVAALGVGIGMMGAAFAGLIGLAAGLPWWKTSLAVVAVILAVSLPSVALTWLKLRRRDLGAILNAGGWAVNRPLRFSARLAREFTRCAVMPPGSATARDPYARTPWGKILVAALALVGALTLWAWANNRGPFQKKSPPPAVMVQPADGALSVQEVAK